MSTPVVQPVNHASQLHIDASTPMGANLVEGGATFRVWAPAAIDVYVITSASGATPRDSDRLLRREDGTFAGFIPDVTDGAPYRFYVVGRGSSGFKRDPWARELGTSPPFPHCDCIVRQAHSYPWHDFGFQPPKFHQLIIYQFHIGVFSGIQTRFLDVIKRIPYLRDLGVTAVQLLPIQEFPYDNSLGYNNTDFFSPEMAYQVEEGVHLRPYVTFVNAILAEKGMPPVTADQLAPGPNQLKALIDLLHLNGIAVIFDLVYNHAGGGFDEQSIYFLDRQPNGNNNNSLYFTDKGWAGGLIFAYWNAGIRDFLIQNAKFFLSEYHIDGARYDEVSVIDNHGGWYFCQDLTNTFRSVKPGAIQIAEYWNPSRELAVKPPPQGMGFDAALADGLRDVLRVTIEGASKGKDAFLNLDLLRDTLYPPYGFNDAWRAVNCLENHDIVYVDREPHELKPRLARLADPGNARSWYARSRSRFATSVLLTAPGIPMLFMGQEILEDKNWSDNPEHFTNTLVWWDGLQADPAMGDFLEFVRALIRIRRNHPALSGPNVNVFHVHNDERVIAFHRWLEGTGYDVVVVGTLAEANLYNYKLGMPQPGLWREIFNSDFFESAPDHRTTGNLGHIIADGPPTHGFKSSALISIPANGVLVFAK
jgi:1,4-alpha-glucan branching enzyme